MTKQSFNFEPNSGYNLIAIATFVSGPMATRESFPGNEGGIYLGIRMNMPNRHEAPSHEG